MLARYTQKLRRAAHTVGLLRPPAADDDDDGDDEPRGPGAGPALEHAPPSDDRDAGAGGVTGGGGDRVSRDTSMFITPQVSSPEGADLSQHDTSLHANDLACNGLLLHVKPLLAEVL